MPVIECDNLYLYVAKTTIKTNITTTASMIAATTTSSVRCVTINIKFSLYIHIHVYIRKDVFVLALCALPEKTRKLFKQCRLPFGTYTHRTGPIYTVHTRWLNRGQLCCSITKRVLKTANKMQFLMKR